MIPFRPQTLREWLKYSCEEEDHLRVIKLDQGRAIALENKRTREIYTITGGELDGDE
jgi:hypothetical protein